MKKIVTNIYKDKYLYEDTLNNISNVEDKIIINDNIISTWLGMGGAITESSSYNYSLLNNDKRKSLIKDYYSKKGLNYNLGRVSIGSNDFSLNSYEYLENNNINNFNIKRDNKYIIPLLKDIYKENKISLIATPWSPPSFMKTNNNLLKGGFLKRKYYSLYSDYLIKFINTYKDKGFNIDYLTIQNEPYAKQRWESCIFPIIKQKKFINKYLINKLNDTKILLWDHNREHLDYVTKRLYINNPNICGIGFHWYTGLYHNKIKKVREKYKDILLINTEMCCGFSKYDKYDWINDAEKYLIDIIGCINSGVNAYLDWNILLDNNGGPSHKDNYVKSAIILNESKSDYIKTPIYYYLYHISHFINKDYKILSINNNSDLYMACAFYKNKKVIIVLNTTDEDKTFEIDDILKDKINSHEIITYVI